MWARNGRWILPKMADFHVAFRNLLHAVNLRHGTDGFTSRRKEGVLRIFSLWKIRRLRPGLNPRIWVPKSNTLPLDHRSRPLIKAETSTSNQAQVPVIVPNFCYILFPVLTFTNRSHICITHNHISYTWISVHVWACARARVLVIPQNTGLCLCSVKRIEKLINVSCGFLMEHCETNQLLCKPQIKCKIKDMPTPHRTPLTAPHKRTGLVTFKRGDRCPFTILGRL